MNHFFGKYRGKVENNVDPFQTGRLQVSVPTVFGDGRLSWAMPCSPFAGAGVGFFALPPVGAHVWVEFEAGNPEKPIWAGGFWAKGEVPASPAVVSTKVLKTDGVTITIDDTPGAAAVKIETKGGVKLTLGPNKVEVQNGQGAKIECSGSNVSVNGGALEVS